MNWGQYIARTAVRRVVWIVVGVVVFAVLGVLNVKAATVTIWPVMATSSGNFSGAFLPERATDGQQSTDWAAPAGDDTGDWIQVAFTAFPVDRAEFLGRGCGGSMPTFTVTTSDGQSVGPTAIACDGLASINLADTSISWVRATFNGTISGDPGYREIAVQPVGGGGGALDAEDKEKLDLLIYTLATIGGVLIVVNTITAIAAAVGSK